MSTTELFFGESQRLELLSWAKGAMVLFLDREGRALSEWPTLAAIVFLKVLFAKQYVHTDGLVG